MSGLDRILFIRHAEHHSQSGFTEDGLEDPQSLNARGWQRAGALIGHFARALHSPGLPNVVYASAIAPDSESRRPQQTVAPLLAYLRKWREVTYCDAFAKKAVGELVQDLLGREGVVLVAWEHSVIPEILAQIGVEGAPQEWPSDRYDLVWSIKREHGGWTLEQLDQRLLVGDR
ncbi:histidine phosphatase family protein [Hansschlegelia quercus]|uniref:Histidine phosphatase family protein n=1 Tax=Hansschlegelia quercus TaxID=2528245 RepID=A0A4Q9GQ58_9HYPH|nr:histidine phosphatase family protein [Hansschlegelia quercus]TBN54934.1 histidine phosphatase family protein [Hansschlegelia quercus]